MESPKFHEARVTCSFFQAVETLNAQVSPCMYWLHNRVGGSDWYVTQRDGLNYIGLERPEQLTFLLLKM